MYCLHTQGLSYARIQKATAFGKTPPSGIALISWIFKEEGLTPNFMPHFGAGKVLEGKKKSFFRSTCSHTST